MALGKSRINGEKVKVYYLSFYNVYLFLTILESQIYFTVQIRNLKIKVCKLIKMEVPSNGVMWYNLTEKQTHTK